MNWNDRVLFVHKQKPGIILNHPYDYNIQWNLLFHRNIFPNIDWNLWTILLLHISLINLCLTSLFIWTLYNMHHNLIYIQNFHSIIYFETIIYYSREIICKNWSDKWTVTDLEANGSISIFDISFLKVIYTLFFFNIPFLSIIQFIDYILSTDRITNITVQYYSMLR